MSIPELVASPEAEVFQVPALTRAKWRGAGLLFVALALGGITLPLLAPGSFDRIYLGFIGTVVFGMLALLVLPMLRAPDQRVRVGDDGLEVWYGDELPRRLPWAGIAAVRERPYLQRVDLLDASGELCLALPYQLDELPVLLMLAAEHLRGAPRERTAQATTFYRSVAATVIPLAASALVVVASLFFFGGILIGAGLFFVFALAFWVTGWLRLTVRRTEIVLRYPLFARRLSLAEVEGFTLDGESAEASDKLVLQLYRRGREPLRIDGIAGGVLPLYHALTAACGAEGDLAHREVGR